MPIAAIKLFGMSTGEWSNLVAVMGLLGAFIAVCLGPLIDRFGIKKTSMISVVLIFAHSLLLALTEHLWVNEDYVMLAVWVLLDPVTMVCAIAIGMSICTKRISATQFAVYMSAANLGASLGSKLFGEVSEHLSYSDSYLLLSLLVFFILVVVALYRKPVPELPEPV
jgi:MFS family permease